MTPPRVAIWTAVSSKPQASPDKTSLQEQEAAGRKFAAAIEGHVVHVYTIPGHSRDLIFWHDAEASMPAYRQLRHDCETHAFDVLFAVDPDRLGRDPALSNQVISLVEKSGAEVYFASAPHPVGQATIGHRYLYAIQTVRAQEDQRRRSDHQRMGLIARVRRGLAASHYPIGYLPLRDPATGKTIGAALDPDLAPAVLLATKHFLAGDTYGQIMHALDASPYHPPRSEAWSQRTVWDMFQRDEYAGYTHYGDIVCSEPSPHFPALWDPDTHAAIIRERARRAHHRTEKPAGSPLGGTVFCGRCGHRMSRGKPHGKDYWLRCAKHTQKSATGKPCHANYIKESIVIQAIAGYLATLAPSPSVDTVDTVDTLDQALAPTDHITPLQADLDHTTRRLTDLDTRRQRLALALAAGQLDPQMYRQADDHLLTDLDTLHTERTRLQALIAAAPDPTQRRQAILDLIPLFPDLIAHAPPAQVRALLHHANLRVEIEAGAITYIGILPMETS